MGNRTGKRRDMARTSREQVRAVHYSVLAYVEHCAKGRRKAACISYREMEKGLGYSSSRVRWACRQLASEGYLERVPCFAKDGGQQANAYAVTVKGQAFMKEYRRASELAREEQGAPTELSSPERPDRRRPQAIRKA